MITYPLLQKGSTIGVTAPSSGVEPELHDLIRQASTRLQAKGYKMLIGDTVWTQEKSKSAPANVRADEFNQMMADDKVEIIIPPWGGELLIEILELLDFENMKKKWVLGYSDTSALLFAITVKTGIATAHGANLVDIRGEYSDETTAMWEKVLSTNEGETVRQYSSEKFQKEWQHDNPSPCVFHLTEETNWKIIDQSEVEVKGRLLGGCVDIIRHLVGTPFGDIRAFQKDMIHGEPILWYFENCDLNTADLRRSLVQMKLAGWFDSCSGILFGRSSANHPVDGYTIEDVYQELSEELQVPIIYDIDCGHVPPQITFINGAFGEVRVKNGKAEVLLTFKV